MGRRKLEFFRSRCLGQPWEKHRIERRHKTKTYFKKEEQMNNWYIGFGKGKWEVFRVDHSSGATTEETGYEDIQGPFMDEEEAQVICDKENN
jgi:hypothetical protein